MKAVKFIITCFWDGRKSNSSLKLNKIYEGTYSQSNNAVYYQNGLEQWVFYPGYTCKII